MRTALDQTKPVEAAHPFVLKLERKGLLLTLEGNVPPNGERSKLRAEINPLGLGIIDHTGYATGAAAGFVELAAFAARRLAEMDPGVATLTDDVLSVMGDALPDADMEKLMESYPSMVSPDSKTSDKAIHDILTPPPRPDTGTGDSNCP